MSKFLEAHVLFNITGPGAMNCNELGDLKSINLGPNDYRARFSSQS